MIGDLTTLDRAKAWLAPDTGQLTSQNDTMIAWLIAAVSRTAMNIMGRDTLARTVRTEVYDGGRTGVLVLRHWPVLAIDTLAIGPTGGTISADDGYTLEGPRAGGGHQRIYLTRGRTFLSPGRGGVSVTYTSGFVTTETLTGGDGDAPAVATTLCWLADEGVTLPNGTPVTGYTVAAGVYTLPPDLAGQPVVVRYSHVPQDVEAAVVQEVALLMRSRAHIGEASKALPGGGGTLSFLPVQISDQSRSIFQFYARTVP